MDNARCRNMLGGFGVLPCPRKRLLCLPWGKAAAEYTVLCLPWLKPATSCMRVGVHRRA